MSGRSAFVDWNGEAGREVMPGDVIWDASGLELQVIRAEMAPGADFPIHSHPHEQIIVVLRGQLDFTVGDERRVAGAGEAIVIPPGVLHGGRVHGAEPVMTIEAFHPVRRDFGHGSTRMDLRQPT
jgi:unsaturated pyranuronate lyase